MNSVRPDVAAVKRALISRLPDLIAQLYGQPNRPLSTRRDWRYGRKGSLSVEMVGSKAGSWFDHESGEGGDALSLIQRRMELTFPAAVEYAVRFLEGVIQAPVAPTSVLPDAKEARRRVGEGLAIWRQSIDPRGTVVETYLRKRPGELALPAHAAGAVIRYHGRAFYEGRHAVMMVSLLRDVLTNEPCGVHRTFLTADGAKLGRKVLGRARSAAIKLDADEDVTTGLVIGEGIESCLAAATLGFRPAWASVNAGGIAAFPVLPVIESLTILRERDAAGERASKACADRWAASGREVYMVTPTRAKDMNDVLSEAA